MQEAASREFTVALRQILRVRGQADIGAVQFRRVAYRMLMASPEKLGLGGIEPAEPLRALGGASREIGDCL